MNFKIFKFLGLFFFVAIFLALLLFLYDLSSYDSSYINKNSVTFNENNLNSKKSKKFLRIYTNFYVRAASLISGKKESYLKPEDPELRAGLPKIKFYTWKNY